jgi:hypothetical protein
MKPSKNIITFNLENYYYIFEQLSFLKLFFEKKNI